MAFRTERTTVVGGAASVQVFQAQAGDLEIYVETTASVRLDGVAVPSVGDGMGLGTTDEWFRFRVRPGDELWAFASSAATVSVFVRSA